MALAFEFGIKFRDNALLRSDLGVLKVVCSVFETENTFEYISFNLELFILLNYKIVG